MARFVWSFLTLAFVALAAGCNRQDTDCLSRIGKKVAAHANRRVGDAGSKVDFHWSKKEPTLQDKIQDRLRWENTLTGIPKEIFQLWSDYLKPRGYRIRYQIIDFPGGVPGDISITISWDD